MAQRYEFNKRSKRHPRRVFRRRLFFTAVALALTGVGVFALTYDIATEEPEIQTSSVVQSEVAESINTFKSPYFQFSDRGNWIHSKTDSTEKEFVYYKYRGAAIEHRLTVHVDVTPIPTYLAATRVLPVRIVNNNRLEANAVAGPCSQVYKKEDLRNIKEVIIQGATMMCDPDSPLFTVALAEVDGNYNLDFRRSNGLPMQIVITYQDMRLDPDSLTISQVAKTFQTL